MNQPLHRTPIEIGIPAYNEEANIQNILRSILEQHQESYEIDRIILVSDGSSDSTVEQAQRLKIPNLKIVAHINRSGKSTRMDELFHEAKTSILVLLDADVVLELPDTIDKLIAPILAEKATLVSGHPQKTKTHAFTDHVMDVSQFLQDDIKSRLNDGDSIYACHGRILALHRTLFSQLSLPYSTVGNDSYLYLANRRKGKGFVYVNDATVLYRMPQTLRDFVKQQRRFAMSAREQDQMFEGHAAEYYGIPIGLKFMTLIRAATKYHFWFAAYLYFRIAALFVRTENKASWDVSESTKNL